MTDKDLRISEIEAFEKGFKVAIAGTVSIYSAGQLTAGLLKKTKPGMKLVLDMSGVASLDSSGIGFVIRLGRELQKNKGNLILCGASAEIRANLKNLRVDTMVQMVETPADIPASFWG